MARGNSALSDKSGQTTKSSVVSRKRGFSDLNLKLAKHPIRKDIIPLKDDAAIKNAVKNLLISNFYERPFQPTLGANLRGLLFEPAGPITVNRLATAIKDVLKLREKRIKVLNLDIKDNRDNNAYKIYLTFKIKEFDEVNEVEVELRRLR